MLLSRQGLVIIINPALDCVYWYPVSSLMLVPCVVPYVGTLCRPLCWYPVSSLIHIKRMKNVWRLELPVGASMFHVICVQIK